GQTFAGRHSTSHLTNAGFSQFIAADQAEYIELAVAWAGRLTDLAALRAQMRDQVRRSPLCNAPQFASDLLTLLSTLPAR
ncbi:MAG: glycosyltransferase, partial [Planctomycetia bacterium]|nr:glycosyltransferase [Planctomycetia bacterium]